MNLAQLPSGPSALLGVLLPPGVATAELMAPGGRRANGRRTPGSAVPAREREFAEGRLCARRAAAQLGIRDCPIGIRADRRPQWPQQLTGSITHTDGFTAAAVGERTRFRAIGIDAERLGSLTRDLWPHVLSPAEVHRVEGLALPLRADVATLLFSAKEAFYKCQYEVTQQWLEFGDVTVDFADPVLDRDSFSVRRTGSVCRFDFGDGPLIGRYAFAGGLVLTALALYAR